MRRLIAVSMILAIAASAVVGFAASLDVNSARLTVVSNTLASTSLDLSLSDAGPVDTGTSVSASASLNGATSGAGGSVEYNVFSDSSCSSLYSAAGSSTVTNGNVDFDSDNVTFNDPGTYYWQATYSGDGDNRPSVSACVSIEVNAPPSNELLLNMSPSNTLVTQGADGTADLEPNGQTQTWESSGTWTVAGTGGWTLRLWQTGPSNFEGAILEVDVWVESGPCGAIPSTSASNYVAGASGVSLGDTTLPTTRTINLSGNGGYQASGTPETICLAITNTEGNNGASHHVEISANAYSSLSGPF